MNNTTENNAEDARSSAAPCSANIAEIRAYLNVCIAREWEYVTDAKTWTREAYESKGKAIAYRDTLEVVNAMFPSKPNDGDDIVLNLSIYHGLKSDATSIAAARTGYPEMLEEMKVAIEGLRALAGIHAVADRHALQTESILTIIEKLK